MSSVDERIVQMQFDNQAFEKNVNTTLGTLGKLNESLDGLNGFNGSNLSESIDNISEKFSALGVIGVTALANITNKLVDLGLEFASSLTIDQLTEGFERYSSVTKDTKAIMNQLGVSVEEANEEIEKLAWYSDATSYSYSSMVSAFKTFSAQNISADDSIPMIMGIGNSLSYAGLAAEEASSGFTIYSKAISQGYLSLKEWRSLSSMGATTAGLKQQFIDAAVALGQLNQAADGTVTTLSDDIVTIENFEQTLSSSETKWLTTDVMKAVFGADYGSYVTDLYEFSQAAENVDKDIETLMEDFAKSGVEIDEFAMQSFLAAQQARTFGEAVNAVKDAAATSWMNIFSNIFGDAEEATEMWGNFSTWLYKAFMTPTLLLDDIIEKWNILKGRDKLLEGLEAIGPALSSIAAPIKEAFAAIFGSFTTDDIAAKLKDITDKFVKFAEKMKLTDEQAANLKKIFEGLFGVIDIFRIVVGKVVEALKPLGGTIFKEIGSFAMDAALGLSDFILKVRDYLETHTGFENAIKSISTIFTSIGTVMDKIHDGFTKLIEVVKQFIAKVKEVIKLAFQDTDTGGSFTFMDGVGLAALVAILGKVIQAMKKLDSIDDILAKVKEGLKGIVDAIQGFAMEKKTDALMKFAIAIGILAAALLLISTIDSEKLLSSLGAVAGLAAILMGALVALEKITGGSTSKGIGGAISKLFSSLTKAIKVTEIIAIASALLILSVAMKILSNIKFTSLIKAAEGIGILLLELAAFMALTKNTTSFGYGGLVLLAAAMLVLAGACKVFATIDSEGLTKAIIAIGALLTEIAVFMAVMNALKTTKIVAASAALVLISTALIEMAAALSILALLPLAGLAQAVGAVAVLSGLFAILMVIGNQLNPIKMVAISTAMLVFGAAIAVLAVGLAALAIIPFEDLAKGVIVIAALIAILGAVSLIGGAAVPIMLGVAAAIALLGVGIAAFAVGMALLAASSVAGMTAFVAGLSILLTAIPTMVTLLANAVATMITALCQGLANSITTILETLEIVLTAVLEFALSKLPAIIEFGFNAVIALLDGIINALPTLIEKLVELVITTIESLATALDNNKDRLLDAISHLIITVLDVVFSGLTKLATDIIPAAIEIVGNFITGFISAIPKVLEMIIEFGKKVVNKVKEVKDDFKQAAKDAIAGFVQGIKEKISSAVTSVKELGSSIISGLKDKLGIHSPSKEFAEIGKYADQGLAKGLKSYADVAASSATEVGTEVVDAMSNAMSAATDEMYSDLDPNPTITPVLDLSEIQNGSKTLSDLVSGRTLAANVTGVSGSVDVSTLVASELSAIKDQLLSIGQNQSLDLSTALKEALAGVGVYMDKSKVGSLVSSYQSNVRRAGGY